MDSRVRTNNDRSVICIKRNNRKGRRKTRRLQANNGRMRTQSNSQHFNADDVKQRREGATLTDTPGGPEELGLITIHKDGTPDIVIQKLDPRNKGSAKTKLCKNTKKESTQFVVAIKEANRPPILVFKMITLLENEGDKGSPLRGRQRARNKSIIKNIHKVRTKDVAEGTIEFFREAIRPRSFRVSHPF